MQTRYSSKEMAVYLLRNGEPITGEVLPEAEKLPELLNGGARHAAGSAERTAADRPRAGRRRAAAGGARRCARLCAQAGADAGAALIVLLGSALAVALAAWISGLLTRPLRQAAAARLARGRIRRAAADGAKRRNRRADSRVLRHERGNGEREAALRAQAGVNGRRSLTRWRTMRTPLDGDSRRARLLGQSS